ncbi:hypothetical protein JB92DRAFT_3093032 [Gautieria morchelliformis]|nr:hypothetical protein JB92DRAFT_3093032 [Gautieria morchelliformis]
MCPMVIDSTDDEVDPAPIKSSSGRVVKPSAALLDPSNIVKVPGQPKHANKRSGDVEQEPPKKKKQKHLPKNTGSKSSGKGKERDVALEDIQMSLTYRPPHLFITRHTRKAGSKISME